MSKEHEVTLQKIDREDLYATVAAEVNDKRELVVFSYDVGRTVGEFLGRDESERWVTVKSENVPRVLLELMRERFTDQAGFVAWLATHDIPMETMTW